MSACENSVSKAKLAEKAKRYDEMFEAMKEVASLHVELKLEERNLLSVAYRNVIGTRRRIISSIEHKGENKGAEEKLQLNNNNHGQNENMELNDISSDMLNVLEKHLIPTASTDESRVFYYTLKGECYSNLGEFATGSNRKDTVENSLVSYKTASNIAMTSLPPKHPIRLNVALQFSKFYYEILNAPDLACRLALAAYDDANLHLTTLGEESYEESALIMQLLRANFTSDNQMGMSVAQERSEIQKHLSQFVVSEDDPGVIFDFIDSRLLEFAIIAVGYRDRGYQSGLLANYIDWNNLTSQEIMNGFRKFVRPPAGGYRQTNHMVAFIPNTLEEYSNVIVRITEFITDCWVQQILGQMQNNVIAHTAILKTDKLSDMQPYNFTISNIFINPFACVIQKL